MTVLFYPPSTSLCPPLFFEKVLSVPQHVAVLIHENAALYKELINTLSTLTMINSEQNMQKRCDVSNSGMNSGGVSRSVDVDVPLYAMEIFTILCHSTKLLHFGNITFLETWKQKQQHLNPNPSSDVSRSWSAHGIENQTLEESNEEGGGEGEDDDDDVAINDKVSNNTKSQNNNTTYSQREYQRVIEEVNNARGTFWNCAVGIFHQHRKHYLQGENRNHLHAYSLSLVVMLLNGCY